MVTPPTPTPSHTHTTDDQFRQEVGVSAGADPTAALRYGLWAARDRLAQKTK